MVWFFKPRTIDQDAVHRVYGDIVARARNPVFFTEWGVPDTLTGRFDVIALHMALFFHRLGDQGQPARAFSQDLFDLFFRDMDRSLREMGVGDLGVPKRIEKLGSLFYGLSDAVAKALADPDPQALTAVMRRNLIAGEPGGNAEAIAVYARDEFARLKALPVDRLISGNLESA